MAKTINVCGLAQGASSSAPKNQQKQATERRQPCSGITIVGGSKPFLEVVVNLIWTGELDVVRDAVFFGQAAGVDETFGKFAFIGSKAQTKIDPSVCSSLDLGEHVIPIQRNHGLARAGLEVRTERFAKLEKPVVDWTQNGFLAAVLFFDKTHGSSQVFFGRVLFAALPFRAVNDPPGSVVEDFVFGL